MTNWPKTITFHFCCCHNRTVKKHSVSNVPSPERDLILVLLFRRTTENEHTKQKRHSQQEIVSVALMMNNLHLCDLWRLSQLFQCSLWLIKLLGRSSCGSDQCLTLEVHRFRLYNQVIKCDIFQHKAIQDQELTIDSIIHLNSMWRLPFSYDADLIRNVFFVLVVSMYFGFSVFTAVWRIKDEYMSYIHHVFSGRMYTSGAVGVLSSQ